MTVTERFEGDLPIQTAETAAERVPQRAVLATSGFGSVGYPKAVPEAIAAADGERADLILQAAHREYRPALSEYRERAADGGGHVPHDLETALSWSGDRRQE